jgi:hypothetical protein
MDECKPLVSGNGAGLSGGELLAQRSSLRSVVPALPRQEFDGPVKDSVAYALQQVELGACCSPHMKKCRKLRVQISGPCSKASTQYS